MKKKIKGNYIIFHDHDILQNNQKGQLVNIGKREFFMPIGTIEDFKKDFNRLIFFKNNSECSCLKKVLREIYEYVPKKYIGHFFGSSTQISMFPPVQYITNKLHMKFIVAECLQKEPLIVHWDRFDGKSGIIRTYKKIRLVVSKEKVDSIGTDDIVIEIKTVFKYTEKKSNSIMSFVSDINSIKNLLIKILL